MGMFNAIFADLRCPIKKEVTSDTEIQIKWQARDARVLAAYHLGDVLEGIKAEYDNTWIRSDYICSACSKQTTGKNGITFIKTEDQQRHPVFVHIDDGKICEILSEQEFEKTGVADFVHYW